MAKLRTFLYILLSLTLSQLSFGQSDYGSENELVKQADRSFDAGDYFTAAPLYSQLSSLYPKDPNFNYRCGVCFLFSEKDKSKAIDPLLRAISMQNPKVPASVHYFLGRAYHLTNQFEEAEVEYTLFLKSALPKELETSDVNRLIEMTKNARLVKASTQLIDIVDRQTLSKEAFVSGYDLNPFKIKVLSIPENYRSAADKKRNENKNLYLMRGSGNVMFASISGSDRTDKDLFIIRNFSPDKNATPENLGANINTPYDEDYPYLTSDGKTLYFSSKGHTSIGGYDLFKSTWNDTYGTWNKPENLGTPINSADDDYFLLMADGIEDSYFATMRESSYDKVTVIKFKIRSKPLLFSSVSASFNQSNPEKENDVRITAYNADQTRLAGIFNPNKSTHDYSIALRAGSDFIIKVEYPGYKTVYDTLKSPSGDGAVQTTEKEILIGENKGETKALALLITAHQINTVEEQLIKKQVENWQANPENAGKELEAIALNIPEVATKSEEQALQTNSLSTNKEIIGNAEQEGASLKSEASQLKQESAQLSDNAKQKESLAKAKESQADDLRKQIEATTDPALKASFTERVTKLSNDAELLNKEAELLTFESQRKEELAIRKSREAEFASSNAQTLKQTSNTSNQTTKEVAPLNAAPKKTGADYLSASNTALSNSTNLKQEAVDLYKQAEDIKLEAAAITDENEKEKTLTRAFNIEMMAKKRQDESARENEHARALKDSAANQGAIPNTNTAEILQQEAKQLTADAVELNKQARALSLQSKATEDPVLKKELSRQAMQLLNQEEEKKKLAEEKTNASKLSGQTATAASQSIETKTADSSTQPANIAAVLSNARLPEVKKQEIVSLLKVSNEIQAQSIQKQRDAKATALASRNTLDQEEKKSLSRQAIQLMNESSTLQAEAEEKESSAIALEKAYESEPLADATPNNLVDSVSKSEPIVAKVDATQVVVQGEEKRNENENKIANENLTQINSESDKKNDLINTPSEEKLVKTEQEKAIEQNGLADNNASENKTIVQQKSGTTESTTQTAIAQNINPEEARAAAMNLRSESEALKMASKNLKYEANNSESEKDKSVKLKESMTLLMQADAKDQAADSLLQLAGVKETESVAVANTELSSENKQRVEEIENAALEKQKQAVALESEARTKNKISDTIADEEKRQEEKLAVLALVRSADAAKAEAQNESDKAAQLEKELQNRERRERELYADNAVDSAANAAGEKQQANTNPSESSKNTAAEQLEADGNSLKQESISLTKQADEVQLTARRMANPADKKKFMAQAELLRASADSKQKEAEEKLAQATLIRSGAPLAAAQEDQKNNISLAAKDSLGNTAEVAHQEETTSDNKRLKTETEFVYAEAVVLEEEARNLDKQAEDQKQIANTSKKKKSRKAASAEAVRLSNLAELKKEEASSKFAEVKKLNEAALATTNAAATDTKAIITETNPTVADTNAVVADSKTSFTETNTAVIDSKKIEADTQTSVTETNTAINERKESNASLVASDKEQAIQADTARSLTTAANAQKTAVESVDNSIPPQQQKAESAASTQPAEKNASASAISKTEPTKTALEETKPEVVREALATRSEQSQVNAAGTQDEKAKPSPTPVVSEPVNTNTSSALTTAPKTVKKISINRNSSTSAYGPSNPIPVNPTLSTGLFFKIQIGAFRNPVPAEIFKGMEPLVGETTASGLTRYLAGDFGAFEPANWAKNEVRALGYKDAFVVAYHNGKRITMPEAKAIIASMQASEKKSYEEIAKAEMSALKENNIYPEKYNNPAEVALVQNFNQPSNVDINAASTNPSANAATPDDAIPENTSTTASTTDAIRYTVQVGVYRNAGVPQILQNIPSLNTERTPSGLIRYTSGIFDTQEAADAARRSISGIVKDAFVIVYKGASPATQSTQQATTSAAVANTKPAETTTTSKGDTKQKQQTTTNTNRENRLLTPKKQGLPDDGKVVYRVQIGTFTDQVPFDIIQKFLAIRKLGIVNQINEAGQNVFYAGVCTDLQVAETILNQAKQAGLTEASIVALKGRTSITLEEAKSALGK